MSRQLRRAVARETARQTPVPTGMDEKQVLMLRLGQKDAQLFVYEMQLNAAQQENARLREELARFNPVEEEMPDGDEGEAESTEGGDDIVSTADVPEGEELPTIEN